MKIFNSIKSFSSSKPTVVTIGTFDGVHTGHKKILEQLIDNARNMGCESLVLTFFPHPRTVIQEGTELKLLNTLDEKIALLENLGIDNLVIHPFDKDFSQLTAKEFVKEVLVSTFRAKKIIIGYDHRFGRNRTANIDDLIAFGNKYNFDVEQISAKEINEVSVSSTKIRTALTEGNIDLANTYLGYPYSLTGIVVKGKQLGRTIGYPTANLKIYDNHKLIPSNGVYIAYATIDNQIINGMLNIGTRPTVDGSSQTIEIHLFDFDKSLYEKEIKISFLRKMREEQKFDSIEILKQQLALDKINAQNFMNSK